MWAKPLPGGGAAVLVLNHDAEATAPPMSVDLTVVPGLACGRLADEAPCTVRDVWAHASRGTAAGGLLPVPALAPHDSTFLVLMPL